MLDENEGRLTTMAMKIRDMDIDLNELADENSDVIDAFNELIEDFDAKRTQLT